MDVELRCERQVVILSKELAYKRGRAENKGDPELNSAQIHLGFALAQRPFRPLQSLFTRTLRCNGSPS